MFVELSPPIIRSDLRGTMLPKDIVSLSGECHKYCFLNGGPHNGSLVSASLSASHDYSCYRRPLMDSTKG